MKNTITSALRMHLRYLAVVAGLLLTANQLKAEEAVKYFEDKYEQKITGVKPFGEYSDPDQYYSTIAKQLGIPKLAYKKVEERYGWKQDGTAVYQAIVKRHSPTKRWQVLVLRIPFDKESKQPDVQNLDQRMVQLDDDGKAFFPDDLEGKKGK
ncbi:hypothetical protein Rhal01_02649 [Rubritalea halochordaticola]|uniref:Uncharacterized protein n=1 Tax=Rubritalea halochordaticola TaxID=714537 RepID=A0ABP9V368_9BACT